MSDDAPAVELRITQEELPRYDAGHGTPDPMVRRNATIRVERREARFEQTDYGHPGRFNEWEPRGIDPALQAQTEQLRDLCARAALLLR